MYLGRTDLSALSRAVEVKYKKQETATYIRIIPLVRDKLILCQSVKLYSNNENN